MPITWDESLATGSTTVDAQHQKLLAKLAEFSDALKQGQGRQEIGAILDFLGRYVVQHFKDEEAIMDRLHCPVAAANKLAHAQFLKRFGELKQRFESEGAGLSLTIEIHDMLGKWLVQHIRGIDVKLREQTKGSTHGVACTVG